MVMRQRVAVLLAAAFATTAAVAGSLAPAAGAADRHRPTHHPAATSRSILAVSGTGVATTGTFNVPGAGFIVSYAFSCAGVPGHQGNFIVSVLRRPGEDAMTILEDRPISRAGAEGAGSARFHTGGSRVYLQVNSDCSWSVAVSR